MPKISIIGAGNVGSLSALRIAEAGLGEVVLVDVVKGLAQGRACDLQDARALLKNNYSIHGTDEINEIQNSQVVVVTAGLTRKPGMTREDLLAKNSAILKEVCWAIRTKAPDSVVIVVTNPLDLMTYLAYQATGFAPAKVFGMGLTLDASRFANLISAALKVPPAQIEAVVIGSHGEAMLPLPRLTRVNGVGLEEFFTDAQIGELIQKTVGRGQEIVSLLGSGSAYFAPSAAVADLVRSVAQDDLRVHGVCAYLNGEYGIKETYIGVPARIGRNGVEQIITLDLDDPEIKSLGLAADKLRSQYAKNL